MRSWRNVIRTSPRPPGCLEGSVWFAGSRPRATFVSVEQMRHCVVFSGTVLRPLLRSPAQLVASAAPAGLLALLALMPPGPALGQPSVLAGSAAPATPATAVTTKERPQPPPPLLAAPGAAALLGGPEPLQIGGPEAAAPASSDVPLPAPMGVPVGPVVPGNPPTPPAPQPRGSQGPGVGASSTPGSLTPGSLTPGALTPGALTPGAPVDGGRPLADPSVAAPPATNLVLDRGRRLLTVYENGRPLRRFAVAVGMPGWETPTGTFRVLEKTINPIWEHPEKGTHTPSGPANPLGSRWIGFHHDCQGRRGWDGEQMLDVKGCVVTGFHGTPHRWTVGRAVSHGCVRLHDEDVRELFDLVTLGTQVTVLP